MRQSSKAYNYNDRTDQESSSAWTAAITKATEAKATAAKKLVDAAEKTWCADAADTDDAAHAAHAAEKTRTQEIEMEKCFPLLSKIVQFMNDTKLENPMINQWADIAIFELNQLYSCYGQKVIIVDTNVNVLQVPRASSRKSFK